MPSGDSLHFRTLTYSRVAGMGRFVPTAGRGKYSNAPSLFHKVVFTNTSQRMVMVKNRTGMTHYLPAGRDGLGGGISIFVQTETMAWAARRISHNLHYADKDEVLKCQYDQIQTELKRTAHHEQSTLVKWGVEYYYDLADIEALGGRVYIPEVDLVLFLREEDGAIPHPFDQVKANRSILLNTVDYATHNAFVQAIKIVDNDDHPMIGSRYIRIGNAVHEIKPEREPQLRNGIHVTCKGAIGSDGEHVIKTVCYSYEEGTKLLGLARTVEQARHLHDPEQLKRELEQRTYEQRIHELELKRKQMEADVQQKQALHELSERKSWLQQTRDMLALWISVMGLVQTILVKVKR